ncbi:hypothetical protein AA0119_g12470 [Alternaria tenuissima]|uniref:Uncharacterized protein n=3 Tax=Alternaria sect. Alternaria TaxID=2499237 RepID=A0A4Q4MY56_ALTAL|nr:hypothetical protein AG0111_0g11671 [Alternaria gaisen]RYN63915.1 hypothetical protein AA0117_g12667 [Alternaria alternata]RYN87300.1 hypothetical protein AA0119_g12470 [Alternaria tenuissima]RYO04381.1 hypothetical protein AA0121_g12830 [Alternaria tenuissima]RYO47923.1 hypothetical protein AA0116_g12833 [Alternaria tenuissima]
MGKITNPKPLKQSVRKIPNTRKNHRIRNDHANRKRDTTRNWRQRGNGRYNLRPRSAAIKAT